jgi:hypothetical protein
MNGHGGARAGAGGIGGKRLGNAADAGVSRVILLRTQR